MISKMGLSKDLHSAKDSHISTPVDAKTEFHLRTDDVKHKCKVGENYTVTFPVVCTSADKEAIRLRQISKPYVDSMKEEKNYGKK